MRSGRWPAGEEWGKMKKTGSRNVGRENGGCFSCSYDRVGRAGKLFVFLCSVKRNLVDFFRVVRRGSP